MVRKSRNLQISTRRVVVNPASGSKTAAPVKARRGRSRSRRGFQSFRAMENELMGIQRGIEVIPAPAQQIALLDEMESGKMTNDAMPTGNFLTNLRNERVRLDGNTEGWYYKYLDPAGSVETARAIGEFSKIPDGLLTFSVDAEIRTIDTLPVPLLEDEVAGPGELPFGPQTWSLTIFSYPMFRTAYIAVANRFDKEIGINIAAELAYTLNNLTSYRITIDADAWTPFAGNIEDGWFFWIKPLPPTYNLNDPVIGNQRSLTSYRLSYKSLTIEHNAPTLVDQGFWLGGHYAIDPTHVQQQGQETEMVPTFFHGVTQTTWLGSSAPSLVRFTLIAPNAPQVNIVSGNVTLVPGDRFGVIAVGDISTAGAPIVFTLPAFVVWYNPFETIFADAGDNVTIVATNSTTITMSSSRAGTTPIVWTLNTQGTPPGIIAGTEFLAQIYIDVPAESFDGRTSNQIEFPAYNPSQIAANNPKMEQFLMKETNGAYIVHKKMRKPVFDLTPAGSFGPVQFTTPGYDTSRNTSDGSGILDTIDANMSTASVCIRGIAHANVVVVKLFQGWEGVTNVNTPFGQFGHTGLERNDSVMQLVDNLTVRTTGVYPANDNFLGLIAKFAAGALKSLLSSEATSGMLGNLAQGVINRGLSAADNRLSRYAR